jgi:hypothetical protein
VKGQGPRIIHPAGTDLAGLLEQLQADQGERFHWPLFSYDESYPTYAWTRAAEAFYDDRHKDRLRCEEELNRRRRVASTTP